MAEAIHPTGRSGRSSRADALRSALTISPALAYGIRFGVAVAAALWIGNLPGLVASHSTWILITVLMVLQPTTGGFLLKGVLRAVGTVAAAFTAILLFGLFAQDPPLLMAGLFLVQAIAAYGFSGPRFQYAWFVWAFTMAIILGDAMVGPDAVEVVAFERASMVGIGILIVLVVESLSAPPRTEQTLRQSLAATLASLAETLRRAIGSPAASDEGQPAAPAKGSLASQLPLLAAVRTEIGVSAGTAETLHRVAMLLESLASRARVLAEPVELPGASEGFAAALNELARRIEAALEEVAAALLADRPPAASAQDLDHALLGLEAELDAQAPEVRRSAALEGRVADLHDLVGVLRALEGTLSAPESSSAGGTSLAGWKLRPDPYRVKVALRAGIAVVVAFLVPLGLGWPVNTMVAPMAFMTAAMTRGAAVQTLTGLAVVVGLGWLVADLIIVYVAPHFGRSPLAWSVPLVVGGVFAFVGAKRPQLAVLPSIGGLIAFLGAFGGSGAPTNVYGPYSTVCYVVVGLGVGWLSGRLLWPATSMQLFRQRLGAQLEQCLEAARAARSAGEVGRDRRMKQLVEASAAQSVQLGTLHQQALHEPVDPGLDAGRRGQVLALVRDLVDAVASDRTDALASLLERGGAPLQPALQALQQADDALLEGLRSAAAAMRSGAAHGASLVEPAHRALEARLAALAANLGVVPELDEAERRRVLVEIASRRRLVARQHAIEAWLETSTSGAAPA